MHPFLTTVRMCEQGIPVFIDEDQEAQIGQQLLSGRDGIQRLPPPSSSCGRFSYPAIPRMWLLGQQHQGFSEKYILTQPRQCGGGAQQAILEGIQVILTHY